MAKPIGIYIHIPFCRKRCAYCDFYTAMCHSDVIKSYVSRLEEEIYRWGGALSRPADTVYFGGGTPSALGADALSKLLTAVKSAFNVSDNAEITLEINPEDASEGFFEKVREAGFNRLSIGIQSLSNQALKVLGRRHSAQDSINAFKLARKSGFDNITVDLMLGLPDGKEQDGINTVNGILSLAPNHISCYMLILEEKTALYAKRESLSFPGDDDVSKEYLNICSILKENGYNHYEISNFSLAGSESRHNLKYWKSEEYLGLGPSAYSFVNGKRFHFANDLKGFIASPEIIEDGQGGDMTEYIMLALRLEEGIKEESLIKLYGKKYSQKFYERAELFCKNGLARFKNGNFCLTDGGMLVSNSIICEMTEEDMYEDL